MAYRYKHLLLNTSEVSVYVLDSRGRQVQIDIIEFDASIYNLSDDFTIQDVLGRTHVIIRESADIDRCRYFKFEYSEVSTSLRLTTVETSIVNLNERLESTLRSIVKCYDSLKSSKFKSLNALDKDIVSMVEFKRVCSDYEARILKLEVQMAGFI